jgi:hypothetical protein
VEQMPAMVPRAVGSQDGMGTAIVVTGSRGTAGRAALFPGQAVAGAPHPAVAEGREAA